MPPPPCSCLSDRPLSTDECSRNAGARPGQTQRIRVRLDRAPLAWDAIARIGDQMMSALALAHRGGLNADILSDGEISIGDPVVAV